MATVDALTMALEKAGIVFQDDQAAPGVRLRARIRDLPKAQEPSPDSFPPDYFDLSDTMDGPAPDEPFYDGDDD